MLLCLRALLCASNINSFVGVDVLISLFILKFPRYTVISQIEIGGVEIEQRTGNHIHNYFIFINHNHKINNIINKIISSANHES